MRFLSGSILPLLMTLAAPPLGAQSIGRATAEAEKLGAKVGVCVLDLQGEPVFARRSRVAVAPASNQKVLTAAAVLHGLGAEYRFVTRFELRGGALVVHASGDPNWIHDTVNEPETRFGEVAAKLQRLGVRAVRDIVLDVGCFTGPARPASWPQNQLHAYYCAPTGPFVLEQGVFRVEVDPRTGTGKARVGLVAPPFGPRIENRTQVIRKKQNPTCGAIDRGDSLLVRGKIWQRSPAYKFRTSVADPARWYARTLRAVLARAGITVNASARPGHEGLVHQITTGLSPSLLRTLRDSSNFDAEQLVRVLGAKIKRDGSLAGGMAAMREGLEDLVGALPAGVALIDGSGLSKDNRVTPELLARALHGVRTRPLGWALFQALPVAGETGSLENRFTGSKLRGKVHAKTGWIRGASSLSGYVQSENGEQFVFSILMSYDRSKGGMNKHFKRIQEDMVEAIAAGRT